MSLVSVCSQEAFKSTLSLYQIRDVIGSATDVLQEMIDTLKHKETTKIPKRELISKGNSLISALGIVHSKMDVAVKQVAN